MNFRTFSEVRRKEEEEEESSLATSLMRFVLTSGVSPDCRELLQARQRWAYWLVAGEDVYPPFIGVL